MDKLFIEATKDTPEIVFDKEKNYFHISGRSLPENAIEFYQPVIDWINAYEEAPNPKMIFNFKLEYFTTSSAKQIIKTFTLLEKLARKIDLTICWHYKPSDNDMYEAGLKFSKLIKIPFTFQQC